MMFWSCLSHALPIILVMNTLLTTSSTNDSDRFALLAFKDQISDNSVGVLSSWNDSLHYCDWYGVKCSGRHPHRVTTLALKSKKLEGTLSPYIGNLSFLTIISLSENNFHGPIPQEIGRLFRLQVLSLDSNSFDGVIPTNLSHCSNLITIDLSDNNLTGGIPVEVTSLLKLSGLYLARNELKGSIPSSVGNLSSLTQLFLRDCNLEGSIPHDLCHIRGLEALHIPSNHLTGIIPSCLYNLSHAWLFSVTDNQLHGSIPKDISLTLPNLQQLYMARNKFQGLIPSSLPNASNLIVIELGTNLLTGLVPRDLGRLRFLQVLALHSNQLGSTSGGDLDFITSLINCSSLKRLSISNNSLKGSIPNSIANLSTEIYQLTLGTNRVHGSIPDGIGNLVNLNDLDLEMNHLTGEISKVIGVFPKMYELWLNENRFSGKIPDSFSNSTLLSMLDLSGNEFHGSIPTSLGDCKNLVSLELSGNFLNGTIPKQVIGLSSLKLVLNLSNNNLSGFLPSEIGSLSSLMALDVSSNKLSGTIPDTLGKCLTLVCLYMKDNLFEGEIPHSFISLQGLNYLDLSRNNFSGNIPEYLENFTTLIFLNLSYNELQGPVPKGGAFRNESSVSIVGNAKLCGGIGELKLLPCHIQTIKRRKSPTLKIVIPTIVLSLCLVVSSCIVLISCRRRVSKAEPSSPSVSSHQHMKITYAELQRATDNFSDNNLVGVGSYGTVYKGILDHDDTIVAVKVFNLQRRGGSRSFMSECNALRNVRHRNLVRIITSCSSMDFQGNEFKAVIFEFMPNGNLDEWLHPVRDTKHELRNLNFIQRLNIAIDVASAIDYLHNHCHPPIVHCDLKPTNVLLNDDMTALLSDFGLAKIFSDNSSDYMQSQGNSLGIKGSIGYVAPEYGMGSEVSTQGDIYSYGILLLEMFTNKRPTDSMFQNGLTLHTYVKTALPEQVMKIVDQAMLLEECHKDVDNKRKSDRRGILQECLVSVISLGITCSAESPVNRMDMGRVVNELLRITECFQGVGAKVSPGASSPDSTVALGE